MVATTTTTTTPSSYHHDVLVLSSSSFFASSSNRHGRWAANNLRVADATGHDDDRAAPRPPLRPAINKVVKHWRCIAMTPTPRTQRPSSMRLWISSSEVRIAGGVGEFAGVCIMYLE